MVGAEYSSFFINLDNYDPWCWPSTPQLRATPSETKPQGSFLVIMDILLWISQIRESKIFQSWLFLVPWYYLLRYFFPRRLAASTFFYWFCDMTIILETWYSSLLIDKFYPKGQSHPLAKLQFTANTPFGPFKLWTLTQEKYLYFPIKLWWVMRSAQVDLDHKILHYTPMVINEGTADYLLLLFFPFNQN